MNIADVWLNGKHLSTHVGGFLPFCVNISDDVKYCTSNVLVVRLNNEDNKITGPKPLKQLDFNMYGSVIFFNNSGGIFEFENVWVAISK